MASSLCILIAVCLGAVFSVSSTPLNYTQTSQDEFYLLVSFDGFRHDYLDMVKQKGRQTPNFDRIRETGVRAQYMKPGFPPTTWPMHWTIATGMHVESHGVVANTFYDLKLHDTYDSPSTPDAKWYNNGSEGGGGEPIWVTYEKAGRVSGAAVWPASTTPVSGMLPTYSLPQDNEGIAMKERVDAIVQWFTSEENPAHLGLLYFDQPDDVGHDFGPDSIEVEDKIVELDGVLGYLLQELSEKQLLQNVNMIITSDHGMGKRLIETYNLDDYVDPSLYLVVSGETPTLMFVPTEANEEKLVNALKSVPHSTYYKKADIPREYFYTYNDRILPHVLMMDEGYRACCQNGTKPITTVSDHGYNNSLPDMWPFFLAHGPAFKSGYVSAPFNNTDIYPLMCHLLGLEPHPNNGSLDNIRHILASEATSSAKHAPSKTREAVKQLSKSLIGLILMFGLAGFVSLIYFTVYKKGHYRRNRVPGDLRVQVPISHPHFALSTRGASSSREDQSKWLLAQDDEADDIEEWTPVSISTETVVRQQTQPDRQA